MKLQLFKLQNNNNDAKMIMSALSLSKGWKDNKRVF